MLASKIVVFNKNRAYFDTECYIYLIFNSWIFYTCTGCSEVAFVCTNDRGGYFTH